MARIVTAAAKLQDIAKTGKVVEHVAKVKHTAKRAENTVKVTASKSVNIKMQSGEEQKRLPLKEVVADCAKRWFQDSLKEARTGDTGMQVLVGQMYYSGYGVPRDAQKGRAWLLKASKSRSRILNLSAKPPGYNASESDSDDQNGNPK
eukprot:Gb_04743 [translate_table: standard]